MNSAGMRLRKRRVPGERLPDSHEPGVTLSGKQGYSPEISPTLGVISGPGRGGDDADGEPIRRVTLEGERPDEGCDTARSDAPRRRPKPNSQSPPPASTNFTPRRPSNPQSPLRAVNAMSPLWSARSTNAPITPSPPTKMHPTPSSSSNTKSPSPGAQSARYCKGPADQRDTSVRALKHITKSVPRHHPYETELSKGKDGHNGAEAERSIAEVALGPHANEDGSSEKHRHRGRNESPATQRGKHKTRRGGSSASPSMSPVSRVSPLSPISPTTPLSPLSPASPSVVGKTRRVEPVPSQNGSVHISRRLPPKSALNKVLPKLISPRGASEEHILESPVCVRSSKSSHVHEGNKPVKISMYMSDGKGGRTEPAAKRKPLLRSDIEIYAPYRQVNGKYQAAVAGASEARKMSDPRWDREDPGYRATSSREPKGPVCARPPPGNAPNSSRGVDKDGNTITSPRRRERHPDKSKTVPGVGEESKYPDPVRKHGASVGNKRPLTLDDAEFEDVEEVETIAEANGGGHTGSSGSNRQCANTIPILGRSYASDNAGIPCIPTPIAENSMESSGMQLTSSSVEEIAVTGENFAARLERFDRHLTRLQKDQQTGTSFGSKRPCDISTTNWDEALADCEHPDSAKGDNPYREQIGSPIHVQVTPHPADNPMQSPLHDAPTVEKCSSSRDHSPQIGTPRDENSDEDSDDSDDSDEENDDDRVNELPSRLRLSLLGEHGGFRGRSDSQQSLSQYPRRDSIIAVPSHLLQERWRRPSLMLEPLHLMNQRKFSHSSAASSRRSSLQISAASSRRSSLVAPDAPRSPRQSISEMQLSPRAKALCLQNDMKAGKTIGMGQFGRVFMAQENETGRLIAVKEIMLPKPPESNDEEGRQNDDRELESLETELILLQTLQHPNVVHYIGHELSPSTSEPERLFIFLEYLAGGSLKSQLNDFGSFTDTLIQKYARQIVNGVYFLHSYNPPIVHRDLKNANLLLTSDGKIKISDFGCSKVIFEETMKSEPGGMTITGTVPYMAPEVLKGNPLGCSQDIWSLGCCILEMCTAAHPWKGFQLDNILHAYKLIAESDMIPPIPKARPKALRDFITACLVRDTADRPEISFLQTHAFLFTTNFAH